MSAEPRVLVAGNPYSGAGPNRARVEALTAALALAGLPARLVWEPRERAALLAAATAPGGYRAVVAAGGDGTVAGVVNDLRSPLPLAVLPLGNENLFARAQRFDGDPVALARAIAAGATHALDVGVARATDAPAPGPRRFTLMLSAGFDAEVAHRVARWRAGATHLRRVRRRSWLPPLARALGGYAHPRLALEVDGAAAGGCCHCVVANLPDYALGLRFAPAARADDGLLDWVVLDPGGAAALARYAWAVWRGAHLGRPGVHSGRARRLTIDAPAPVPVQVDGDAWGFTPVTVEVLPGALTVVTMPRPAGHF